MVKHKSKHKSRRTRNDEENQLQHVDTNYSEGCVTPSIEAKRRVENEDGISRTPHANTMPMLPAKLNGTPSSSHPTDYDRNARSQDSTIATSDKLPAEAHSSDGSPVTNEKPMVDGTPMTDGKPIADSQPVVDHSLRKRIFKVPHFGHKGSDEKDEIVKTRSSNSQNPKPKFTVMGQLRATIFNSWLNVLFVFIPIGIAMNYANVSPVVVFATNFVAIIPLAAMLSYATEEIALRTGETIGGLLNATFG